MEPQPPSHELEETFCPYYTHAVELVGRRWSGAIVRALLLGCHRFNELAAAIPGISDRMLSERLKELEAEGLVVRAVTPDTPVRVSYHLTPKGEALHNVITAMAEWAAVWLAPHDIGLSQDAPATRAAR